MEQILKTPHLSELFLCLRIFLRDIKTKGFLSFFWFFFQSLFRTLNPKPQKQSTPNNTHSEVRLRLSKEEVIMVMGKLGLGAEPDEEGLSEEIGEEEVEELFEREPSFEEVKNAFEVFDENEDGFIEARELQRVLKCLGMEREIGECERMVDAVDQNGDGVIDHYEFVKFLDQSFGVEF